MVDNKERKIIIRKLSCPCGFSGDLLENSNVVVDDIDHAVEMLHIDKNKDGLYECPECGEPIMSRKYARIVIEEQIPETASDDEVLDIMEDALNDFIHRWGIDDIEIHGTAYNNR